MRKGRDGEKREKNGGKKTGKKTGEKKERRQMKIVATTSLPAVDRPDADRWNAARSRQKSLVIKYVNGIYLTKGMGRPKKEKKPKTVGIVIKITARQSLRFSKSILVVLKAPLS